MSALYSADDVCLTSALYSVCVTAREFGGGAVSEARGRQLFYNAVYTGVGGCVWSAS